MGVRLTAKVHVVFWRAIPLRRRNRLSGKGEQGLSENEELKVAADLEVRLNALQEEQIGFHKGLA